MRTERNWQALLTTVIAVVAIALAAWEGLENRRHNRLSVAPRLNGSLQLSRESASLSLSSNGLGPAVVKQFRIYLDNKLQHDAGSATATASPWQALITELDFEAVTVEAYAFGAGTLLRAGEDYKLFSAAARDTTKVAAANLAGLLDRIAVEVCYCSIYDDQCNRAFVGSRDTNTKGCR